MHDYVKGKNQHVLLLLQSIGLVFGDPPFENFEEIYKIAHFSNFTALRGLGGCGTAASSKGGGQRVLKVAQMMREGTRKHLLEFKI